MDTPVTGGVVQRWCAGWPVYPSHVTMPRCRHAGGRCGRGWHLSRWPAVIASTATVSQLSVSLDLEHVARLSAVECKQHKHQHWSSVPSGTAAPLLGGNHGSSAPMDVGCPTTAPAVLLPTTPTAFRRYLMCLGPVPRSPDMHSTHGAGAVSFSSWRGAQESESGLPGTIGPTFAHVAE